MPTTPNKGYQVQVTGTNIGTWGDVLNNQVFVIQDNNLGGIVSKTVAGSNISLSSTESQMVILRLTGAQSADIQVTTSCIGFFFVENLTSNSFAITITNGVAGVVVPKGRSTIIADTTNGCRIAGTSTDNFASGTRIVFQQTAAPTGWTKEVGSTYADSALRINIGTVTQGGSLNFSTVFTSVRGITVDSHTLTISEIPAHSHALSIGTIGLSVQTDGSVPIYKPGSITGSSSGNINMSNTGFSGGHSHTGSVNLAVKYTDVTIAQKN